ncbi:hypothetical protein GF386_03245 [Candidatus Pacearchaeota archaeon]|nr:hypothetical protein [Candidatus Pacearchaeota archaeon]MBD3283155.1 hypothetical protein [Candidatus Pacearchaeota archaeon]
MQCNGVCAINRNLEYLEKEENLEGIDRKRGLIKTTRGSWHYLTLPGIELLQEGFRELGREIIFEYPKKPRKLRIAQGLPQFPRDVPYSFYQIERNKYYFHVNGTTIEGNGLDAAGLGAVYALLIRDLKPEEVPYDHPYFNRALKIYRKVLSEAT